MPSAPASGMIPGSPAPAAPPADHWATERSGIRLARLAALLSLLGLVVALAAPLAFLVVLGLHIPIIGTSFGSAAFTIVILEERMAIILVGVLLMLGALTLYLLAFAKIRRNADGFGAPMVLTLLGLLGAFLLVLGAGLILGQVYSAVNCAAGAAVGSCISLSTVAAGVYAILGGLFLAFLGWIGLILGLYRMGKRYDSGLTKVGAILYIIPFLNLVATILVFIGIHGTVEKYARSAPPGAPASG